VEVALDKRRPTIEMQIEVHRKVPVCTELRLVGSGNGAEVRNRNLRSINIDSLIERVVPQESMQFVDLKDIPPPVEHIDEAQLAKNIAAAKRRQQETVLNVQRVRAGRPRIQ